MAQEVTWSEQVQYSAEVGGERHLSAGICTDPECEQFHWGVWEDSSWEPLANGWADNPDEAKQAAVEAWRELPTGEASA